MKVSRKVRRVAVFALAAAFSLSLEVSGALGQDAGLSSQIDKESYTLGYQFGDNMKKQKMEVNNDALLKGMQDAMSGQKSRLETEEMRQILTQIRQKMMAAQQQAIQEQASKNLEAGKAFLAENEKKEGVVKTASGLQYKILKEGTGTSPKIDSTVSVHYRGTLIDGTEFDSSFSRNEPATFKVNEVIPGWTEALLLMKEGSKWELVIPPSLAYGERGMGGRIGPNSTLKFEVELLSVNKQESKQESKKDSKQTKPKAAK